MEALTALMTGIVLASLSGITGLAFKYPKAFEKLYPLLNLVATIVFLGLTIWQGAIHVTWSGIQPFIDHEQLQDANLVKASLTLPYIWICVIYTAFLVYLWINRKLPSFVRNVNSAAGSSVSARHDSQESSSSRS